jgi:zinc protease
MSRTATVLILALLSVTAARAQTTSTDPPRTTDGDVTVGWVHGMQILVKRVPNAEWVAGQLYIRGGARNWTKQDAGVERLALAASLAGGTETLEKAAFSHRLAKLGAALMTESNEDFSMLQAKSLRAQWDETFALLADAFLHPALPPSEIELQRQRQLAELKHEEDVPDMQLNVLAHRLMFENHPYQQRAIGTPETVAKLDAPALRAHLAKLRETGRLVLVVVGDVDGGEVIERVRATLGGLPRGSWRATALPTLTLAGPRFNPIAKKLATNYIMSMFIGPGWHDSDFSTALVAMDVLQAREFLEVRTKRNLSYAPWAWLSAGSAVPTGALYVTAVDPKAAMTVMLDEAQRLAREPLLDSELAGNKSVFLSRYLMNGETMDGLAGQLARAQLFGGDWHLARTLPARIRAVSVGDVQAFAKRYIHKLQTVYVGDPSKMDRKLFDGL